jgi:hypothetical protein
MRYACLVYVDPALMGALPTAERARLDEATLDYDADLIAQGRIIMAQPLLGPETAVTVRVRGGRRSRTDGPFAETKEHFGGFFLLDVADIEEAVALAGESPMARLGSIEIRPFYMRERR